MTGKPSPPRKRVPVAGLIHLIASERTGSCASAVLATGTGTLVTAGMSRFSRTAPRDRSETPPCRYYYKPGDSLRSNRPPEMLLGQQSSALDLASTLTRRGRANRSPPPRRQSFPVLV